MNVFVLNTGRCGSLTFYHACQHITNFTVGHESQATELGKARFAYPLNHIEIDNRLSWMLGTLERKFGRTALYVHLRRDQAAVAASFERRWIADPVSGIMPAFYEGVLMRRTHVMSPQACHDLVRTQRDNIELFLKGKRQVTIDIEKPDLAFRRFWDTIHAEGDFGLAMGEMRKRYNKTTG